jgi:hypothetical protein
MKKQKYTSLEDIRSEKEHTQRQITYGVDRLKNDVTDCFVSPTSIFLRSSNKYMNYIGYGISAYKAFQTFRGVFNFFSKKR